MSRDAPEVAFVLPAGGSAGAAQVGSLLALLEAGIVPDVLVGCSVGALNATYLAIEPSVEQVQRLAEIWAGLTRAQVFGSSWTRTLIRVAAGREHVYEPDLLRSLIRRFCPMADLSDTAIPVHVVSTDLDAGTERWWSRGAPEEVLYASACLPGLFPPAVLDGHRHVDGGVLEPIPVERAVGLDARTIYVIGDVVQPTVPSGRMHALAVVLHAFAISRYARLPDPEAMAHPGQEVIVLPGAPTQGIDLRDFSHTRRLIDESHALTSARLEHLGRRGGDALAPELVAGSAGMEPVGAEQRLHVSA
ncbi:MAG TPA: patatin-like phospholipase family protein [Acidimicrobiales bacterium]|nr:patatin-like phospholipase family protein [Acidimicrobiales bacterium]